MKSPACHGGESELTIKVSLTKEHFLDGAPIPVDVSLTNTSGQELKILFNYPTLSVGEVAGLEITEDGSKKEPWYAPSDPILIDGDGRISVISIKANDTFHTCIFLNRYNPEFKVGKHKINYSLSIATDDRKSIASAKGLLEFSIDPILKMDNLLEIFNGYIASATGGSKKQREAIEAITTVTMPEIIPYLDKLIQAGEADHALPALYKFKGSKKAEAIVLTALNAPRSFTIVRALDVLKGWKYPLPKDRLIQILDSGNEYVRQTVIGYIDEIGDLDYVEVVHRSTLDKDPRVAELAKTVAKKLTEKQKQELPDSK